MSVNKYLPHVFVLPEDDANRQIANGFLLEPALIDRQIRILEEAGGWNEVLKRFDSVHADEMDRFPERLMVLLIDFDGNEGRLEVAKNKIPQHLKDRVFILGTLNEPEDLKQDLGSYEAIGLAMAKDCREETNAVWEHLQLRHNSTEIHRLRLHVRPILFGQT